MTFFNLMRCRLAMWIDRQKYVLDDLAIWISPESDVWEEYDKWAQEHGLYDWMKRK